jgi:hypothetical protein
MLARSPFKTAEELGLAQAYYEGLTKVLEKMKNGELVWTPVTKPVVHGFNMGVGWRGREGPDAHLCKTVGCIAGWAATLADRTRWAEEKATERTPDQSDAWYGLVTPDGWENGQHTLEQAQVALESYLLTGKADWS